MKLSTKQIIEYLPFDKEFKTQLLSQWDTLDPDVKLEIEDIVWDAYDIIYEMKLEENTQAAMQLAENNEENFDDEFFLRIREKTDKDMQLDFSTTTEHTQLDMVRTKLESLMNKQ